MIKAANVLVTEKRGMALKHDEVVLFQFLDASMAFDKTLIPIMLKIAFQSGIDDDKWMYLVGPHNPNLSHDWSHQPNCLKMNTHIKYGLVNLS